MPRVQQADCGAQARANQGGVGGMPECLRCPRIRAHLSRVSFGFGPAGPMLDGKESLIAVPRAG
jgi:hypothetical protein